MNTVWSYVWDLITQTVQAVGISLEHNWKILMIYWICNQCLGYSWTCNLYEETCYYSLCSLCPHGRDICRFYT